MRGGVILSFALSLAACSGGGGDADAGLDGTTPDAAADADLDAGQDLGPPWVPAPFTPTAETRAYCAAAGGDDDAVEAQITTLLGELTVTEKVALLHGASGGLVGGTWLVRGNDRLGIPGLHMLDGPRGVSKFTGLHATAFPVAMLRGATWDPSIEERVGAALAREERSAGADVVLGPTMNILRHPRWGRAQETYSEDTFHMGEMAVAFVRGVQSQGLLASAKHFAGNSIENTRHVVDVHMDERTLREVYTPHFRRVVQDAHVGSVMSAYNQVNGLYCDENPHLLTDLLRDAFGFSGFVESDWVFGTHADVASLRAGLDIEMPTSAHFVNLPREVADGTASQADLDVAVRHVLRAQLCFGLATLPPVDASERESPEHLALAREAARRGIVLLENRPADGAAAGAPNVLPIDAAHVTRLALLGRNADYEAIGDDGSSDVLPTSVVTALEGLTARAGSGITVTHVPGTTLDAAATATVSAADVVVIVTGMQASDEGEGDIAAGDRTSLALPPDEVALIHAAAAVSPHVVVVLEGGTAILTSDWHDEVEAVLWAGYPGSEGGDALADVLFGDAAPTGRLPFSVPAQEADLPPFDDVSPTVTYGYLHGYRYLDAMHTAPTYAFGYGLGYTTFAYSGLTLASSSLAPDGTLDATVTVQNTGSVAGTETVQLYVAATGSAVMRAPDDLRAFAQVTLDPGASAPVTLHVPVPDLATWDDAAGAWVVERLPTYEVRVGPSAAGPFETATFAVP